MTIHKLFAPAAALAVSAVVVLGTTTGAALAHSSRHHKSKPSHTHGHKSASYVSPAGKSGAADHSCKSAAFSTVQSAVDAAPAGSTVVVCRGAYTEDVVISTPLTLSGRHGAVIHGAATSDIMCDQAVPGAPTSAPCLAGITIKSSNVTVQGLKVTGATGEGILATGSAMGGSISHVTIKGNRVVGNNTGGIPPTTASPYPQCVASGEVPGDCGEGIHLMGVDNSTVSHNFVSQNEGGVLLTDEFGPTHNNIVSHNVITKNPFDCGVTVPGHNPTALDSSGNPQPSVAGVYDNVISHNRITDNGLQGEGAGVLFATPAPGTASYNNLVTHNYIAGNELSGVTMHAHTVGSDLSGNRIVHNTIGKNNTGGDLLEPGVSDPSTTGILVFSASVPVTVTIAHNRIRNNTFGVWLGVSGNVTATMAHNVFQHVTTSVFTSP